MVDAPWNGSPPFQIGAAWRSTGTQRTRARISSGAFGERLCLRSRVFSRGDARPIQFVDGREPFQAVMGSHALELCLLFGIVDLKNSLGLGWNGIHLLWLPCRF